MNRKLFTVNTTYCECLANIHRLCVSYDMAFGGWTVSWNSALVYFITEKEALRLIKACKSKLHFRTKHLLP